MHQHDDGDGDGNGDLTTGNGISAGAPAAGALSTKRDALSGRAELLGALGEYRLARQRFLQALGCASSNRDPLAEFAERLARSSPAEC